MASLIDGPRSELDTTVKIFDQFYNFELVVEANQYELVHSYFFNITKNKNSAANFTTILFRISNITGENPLALLDEMKSSNSFTASGILTYYLNSLKSKSTLYGVSNTPQPNQTVQRNIVQ
jgi:hypothetical protein